MRSVFTCLPSIVVVSLFMFISGFMDAFSYTLLQVFSSSQVGNVVISCVEWFHASSPSNGGAWASRSAVFTVYVLSAGLAALVTLKLRLTYNMNSQKIVLCLLALEIWAFISLWVMGNYLSYIGDSMEDLDSSNTVIYAGLVGTTMGFQSLLAMETGSIDLASTLSNLISGLSNLVSLSLACCCCQLTPPNGPNGTYTPVSDNDDNALLTLRQEVTTKVLGLVVALASFTVGALTGAAAATCEGVRYNGVVIPLLLLTTLVIDIIRDRSSARQFVVAKQMAAGTTPPRGLTVDMSSSSPFHGYPNRASSSTTHRYTLALEGHKIVMKKETHVGYSSLIH